MSHFKEALDALLKYVTNPKHSTWIATLQEIYQWWKERNTFSFRIEKSGENEYCVQCNCSPRATVLLKRQFNSAGCSWDNYHVIQDRPFIYRGARKPAIGIPSHAPDALQSNLRAFGFAYEISSRQEDYEMFLDEKQYAGKSARDLLEFIENSSGKVLRFWNWPDGHKCAFSASSDVDSITLFDFYYRAKELTNYRAFIKTEEQSRDKEKNKVKMVLESAFSNDPQVRRKAYTLAEKGYQVVIDCVHVLGALCYRQQVGTFGRAAFFSTEETKIISTTMGGMNSLLFHQLSNRR